MKTVRRSEIIQINLNPTERREQSGKARPCLILSNTKFNQRRQGIIVVTLLTNTIRPQVKIMIQVPEGYKATGSVIVEQVRTIDLKERWWKSTEEILAQDFVDLVVHTFSQIIG